MPSSYEYEDDFTTDDEGNNDDEEDAAESVHYNSRWVLPTGFYRVSKSP